VRDIKAFVRSIEAAWAAGSTSLIVHEKPSANAPARALSIVGTSHKPWFDGWLGQLQGGDIVDVAGVLQ
jgi:hypothetical protein